MHFCHIAPTEFLEIFAAGRSHHLTLAHLVEQDQKYADFYLKESESTARRGGCIIMDNSAFEMYKRGEPMYPSDKLIEMGKRCGADYIVMTDHPGKDAQLTIDEAIKIAPELRDQGFGTFFVPQSEIGDVDQLVQAFLWAADSPAVDYIGISILAIPNAYGVESGNKLQRFTSRWAFLRKLELETNFFQLVTRNKKKLHMLGMTDGPNEIALLGHMISNIDTWDSSAAVWAGLNGVRFDNSPTGLLRGKVESEVDFSLQISQTTAQNLGFAMKNLRYIDNLIEEVLDEW